MLTQKEFSFPKSLQRIQAQHFQFWKQGKEDYKSDYTLSETVLLMCST